MKNKYSYPQINSNKYLNNFFKKRSFIIKKINKENNNLSHYTLNFFDYSVLKYHVKGNNLTIVINELIDIYKYYKKKRSFSIKYDSIINFLQKEFEVNQKINFFFYKKNNKKKINSKNFNEINTISLFSYILLLRFSEYNNFSDLSTSMKISDYILLNFKKKIIINSNLSKLMFFFENKLVKNIVKKYCSK